jgi:uncharacterized protein YcaQ
VARIVRRSKALAALRRTAVGRSLRPAVAIEAAVRQLGFVQADPIRAPARAQDLILRHRVVGYRAGDLEQRYPSLPIEEAFFVNYGFLPREVYAWMHPRSRVGPWPRPGRRAAAAVLAFVRARGRVHPREVDARFGHGSVTNYWGGFSSATTHLLDHLHYRGLLRVAAREGGIRLYEPQAHAADAVSHDERRARLEALLHVLVRAYAPLPPATLSWFANRLRLAVPQWARELPRTLARVRRDLPQVVIEGLDWYLPPGEELRDCDVDDAVRFLAPFDPLVWDRRRFEAFWGWPYRFEAYTPASKRRFGYYALPVLWRDEVVGWATVTTVDEAVRVELGYPAGRPLRDRTFRRELDLEVERLRIFLRPRR